MHIDTKMFNFLHTKFSNLVKIIFHDKAGLFPGIQGSLTYTMQYAVQHINILKEINHMIISIKEKLVFVKAPHPFITKTFEGTKSRQ